MSEWFATQWFVAAIVVDGTLSSSRIFEPGSDLRIGCAPNDDFVVETIESRRVVASGVTLRLAPGAHVRMGGASERLTTADDETDGPDVAVVAPRVKLVVSDRITVLLAYFPTRAEAEALVAEQAAERALNGPAR